MARRYLERMACYIGTTKEEKEKSLWEKNWF